MCLCHQQPSSLDINIQCAPHRQGAVPEPWPGRGMRVCQRCLRCSHDVGCSRHSAVLCICGVKAEPSTRAWLCSCMARLDMRGLCGAFHSGQQLPASAVWRVALNAWLHQPLLGHMPLPTGGLAAGVQGTLLLHPAARILPYLCSAANIVDKVGVGSALALGCSATGVLAGTTSLRQSTSQGLAARRSAVERERAVCWRQIFAPGSRGCNALCLPLMCVAAAILDLCCRCRCSA